MKFVYNDGGRAEAGFKGTTGDCACRAISIATGRPYKEIYKLINDYGKTEYVSKKRKGNNYNGHRSSARTGVYKDTFKQIMEDLGWKWVPTMLPGFGCKTHLNENELPSGRIIVNLSKHYAAVINGVLNDIFDCTRDGNRCVYGYFVEDKNNKRKQELQ